MSKPLGRLLKILWPSLKSWTLLFPFSLKLSAMTYLFIFRKESTAEVQVYFCIILWLMKTSLLYVKRVKENMWSINSSQWGQIESDYTFSEQKYQEFLKILELMNLVFSHKMINQRQRQKLQVISTEIDLLLLQVK